MHSHQTDIVPSQISSSTPVKRSPTEKIMIFMQAFTEDQHMNVSLTRALHAYHLCSPIAEDFKLDRRSERKPFTNFQAAQTT